MENRVFANSYRARWIVKRARKGAEYFRAALWNDNCLKYEHATTMDTIEHTLRRGRRTFQKPPDIYILFFSTSTIIFEMILPCATCVLFFPLLLVMLAIRVGALRHECSLFGFGPFQETHNPVFPTECRCTAKLCTEERLGRVSYTSFLIDCHLCRDLCSTYSQKNRNRHGTKQWADRCQALYEKRKTMPLLLPKA